MFKTVVIIILILIVISLLIMFIGLNKNYDLCERRLDDRNRIISAICLKYKIPIDEVLYLSDFKEDIDVKNYNPNGEI